MYTVNGEPRLSAKGHEVFAEMHEDSASVLRKAAAEMPPEHPETAALLGIAARQEGASKGHLFRAEELRYDARGGMTEELARRRFEPGAAWSVRGWWTGVVLERNGERVLFSEGYAEHIPYMTRENGWLFLGLSDAAGGHVPPGGWP